MTSASRSSRYEVGDEPVPGYRLDKWIGEGGMGEVWQATSAGGIKVALKIIYGLQQRGGRKEFRSLQLIKNINHPNLAKVFAFWLKDSEGRLLDSLADPSILEADSLSMLDFRSALKGESPDNSGRDTDDASDGLRGTLSSVEADDFTSRPSELIIAMGLGESTLFDLLKQYQSRDAQGIPFGELMGYLESAARAIDFLNTRHNIQHCDIKPSNILVVGGSTQVCDFGLAKSIHDTRKTTTAFTVAYGAPELDKNAQTWSTDQYSLAITYVELLTGRLPFPGENIPEVVHAKLTGKLDLSRLPKSDWAAVRKATDLNPDLRHVSCAEFIRCLQEARSSASPAKREPRRERSAPSGRRRQRAWFAVGLISLLAMAAVAILFPEPRDTVVRFVSSLLPQPSPVDELDAQFDQLVAAGRFADAYSFSERFPAQMVGSRRDRLQTAWRTSIQEQRQARQLEAAKGSCEQLLQLYRNDAEVAAWRGELIAELQRQQQSIAQRNNNQGKGGNGKSGIETTADKQRQLALAQLEAALDSPDQSAAAALNQHRGLVLDRPSVELLQALVRRVEQEVMGRITAVPLLDPQLANSLVFEASTTLPVDQRQALQRRLAGIDVIGMLQQPAMDYVRLAELAGQVRDGGGTGDVIIDAIVDSAYAEGRSADPDQALDSSGWLELDRLTSSAEQQLTDSSPGALSAYGRFVRAVVQGTSRNPDLDAAVATLTELSQDVPPLLRQPTRAKRAQEILLAHMARLNMPSDRQFELWSAESTDRFHQALEQLNTAARFGPHVLPKAIAYQAMSTVYRHGPDPSIWPPEDWQLAQSLTEGLLSDERTSGELARQRLLLQIRFVNALTHVCLTGQSNSVADRERATHLFAELARQIAAMPAADRAQIRGPWQYDRLLQTPLSLWREDDEVPTNVRGPLAQLYIMRARLIQSDPEVAKRVAEQVGAVAPLTVAHDSFQRANQLLPTAETLVAEGRALIERPMDEVSRLDQLRQLAQQAKSLDASCASAFGLLGYTQVLSARRPDASVEQRLQLLQEAIDSLQQAIRIGGDGDSELPLYHSDLSAAHLESSFWNSRLEGYRKGEPDNAQFKNQHSHLEQAVTHATRAAELARNPQQQENTYNALGNAYEDQGLYLGLVDQFKKSVDSFGAAFIAADSTFRSGAKALMNRGRCQYRWVQADASLPADVKRAMLQRALDDLQEGERRANDDNVKAEILLWNMFVNTSLAKDAEPTQRDGLLENADQAGQLGVQLAKGVKSSNWPRFQLDWAYLALARGQAEQARHRALAVIHEHGDLQPSVDDLHEAVVILVKSRQPTGPVTDEHRVEQIKEISEHLDLFRSEDQPSRVALSEMLLGRCNLILSLSGDQYDSLCQQDLTAGQQLATRLQREGHPRGLEYLGLFVGSSGIFQLKQAHRTGDFATYRQASMQLSQAIQMLADKIALTAGWRIRLAQVNRLLISQSSTSPAERKKLAQAGFEALQPLRPDNVPGEFADKFEAISGLRERLQQLAQ